MKALLYRYFFHLASDAHQVGGSAGHIQAEVCGRNPPLLNDATLQVKDCIGGTHAGSRNLDAATDGRERELRNTAHSDNGIATLTGARLAIGGTAGLFDTARRLYVA